MARRVCGICVPLAAAGHAAVPASSLCRVSPLSYVCMYKAGRALIGDSSETACLPRGGYFTPCSVHSVEEGEREGRSVRWHMLKAAMPHYATQPCIWSSLRYIKVTVLKKWPRVIAGKNEITGGGSWSFGRQGLGHPCVVSADFKSGLGSKLNVGLEIGNLNWTF